MPGGVEALGLPPSLQVPLSFQHSLSKVTKETEARSIEANSLFQGISQALDLEINAVKKKKLPPLLEKAFSHFCKDIFAVAQAHFHSHICGSALPPPPYSPKSEIGNRALPSPKTLQPSASQHASNKNLSSSLAIQPSSSLPSNLRSPPSYKAQQRQTLEIQKSPPKAANL